MLIKNSFHLIKTCTNCENDKAHVTHADRNSRAWTEIGIRHCKGVIDAVTTFKIHNFSNLELEKKIKKERERREKTERKKKNTSFYFNYNTRLWVYILYILL
jgi:hypothetical protein